MAYVVLDVAWHTCMACGMVCTPGMANVWHLAWGVQHLAWNSIYATLMLLGTACMGPGIDVWHVA